MRVLELFAGLGACSCALRNIGIEEEIVDAVEIDAKAIGSFNAIHKTNFEVQDITKWDKEIEVDMIMHGSPCQDFSIAGKQAGGDIGSGTRSSLMYETIRIIGKLRPKYVIWENVKNLLSKNHIHNFHTYIHTLETLGYNSYYEVLNAKDYGIPQNRERVFTVSIRKDIKKEFRFPKKEELGIKLKDLLEEEVEEKYYLTQAIIDSRCRTKFNQYSMKSGLMDNEGICKTIVSRLDGAPILVRETLKEEYCNKLLENGKLDQYNFINHSYSNSRMKDLDKRIYKNEFSPTLTTRPDTLGFYDGSRIRKLTPLECWRLMGFSDEDYERAKSTGLSDNMLYKQAGNSIVVKVLEKLFTSLFKE